MKNYLQLTILLCVAIVVNGQGSILNGNFENWDIGTYEYPQNYPYTTNSDVFFMYQIPFNEVKTTDAYHGSYAVMLTNYASVYDSSSAYISNNVSESGNPYTWTGGIPYNQVPTGIRGYYKYNVENADSGTIIIPFSKAGNNIGTYILKLGGVHTSYTPFNFVFDPPLTQTPDSVMIGITSCNIVVSRTGIPGSTLLIDSISFTGVSSQPALMNGDFETWQSQTLYKPFYWYSQPAGMYRTTDAAAGNYALELVTYQGSIGGNAVAMPGRISTGYWVNSCNCVKEGTPFTNQTDTLAFYYKYSPSGNDTAGLNVNFYKDGSIIFGSGTQLTPTDTYQYVELPFNAGQAPDTVIINITSSEYENSGLSYVGSVLKIDEMHFKSTPLNTGIENTDRQNRIVVSSNPSGGKFQLEVTGLPVAYQYKLEVYTLTGEKAYGAQLTHSKPEIDITHLPNGIYIVKIEGAQGMVTTKIVKQ